MPIPDQKIKIDANGVSNYAFARDNTNVSVQRRPLSENVGYTKKQYSDDEIDAHYSLPEISIYPQNRFGVRPHPKKSDATPELLRYLRSSPKYRNGGLIRRYEGKIR